MKNLSGFISKRIKEEKQGSFSSTVIKIATVSVAVGAAVMVIAFAILGGFKNRIHNKILSFSGHIIVTKYNISESYSDNPVSKNCDLYLERDSIPGVEHVHTFARKLGLVRNEGEIMGVVIKGIGENYNPEYFSHALQEGSFLDLADSTASKGILISEKMANNLRLSVGDSIVTMFVQDPPRYRKLHVKGIYETGLEEFDKLFVLGDLRLVQDLNDWSDSLVGGLEVFVKDFEKLEKVAQEEVFNRMDPQMYMELVTDKYVQLFDWLQLLDKNVLIFFGIIIVIASFNIVSSLFILIMERTNMVGMLKALGATNWTIRKIFATMAIRIIGRGLFLGNAVALGFCAIQDFFKPISLDPENYYMSTVPILWDWWIFLGINALIFIVAALVVLLPTWYISRISPIRAIRFD